MTSPHPAAGQTNPAWVDHPSQLTMYDLPSEFPGEPGLPDVFQYLQPHLLSATLRLTDYVADQVFTAGDLNLYYDPTHPLWHKRPDWFAVAGVPRLYEQRDLRSSYVIWQEQVIPAIVVELLSPGTAAEDLGRTPTAPGQPPTKWQVYEQILQVPYYIVFDRQTDYLQVFTHTQGRYTPIELTDSRTWLPSLKIGIGLWHGTYEGITRHWLRWYDTSGQWILTDAEAAQQKSDRLAARLRELGVDPDTV